MAIDPTARVATGAIVGTDVTIGPFCTVGPHVQIGDGCVLQSHVNIEGHTTLGARNKISPFVSLGGPPQSIKYAGEPTRLEIGSDNTIREHVTMNIGTHEDGGLTKVGDRNFIMTGTHVAHDCKVGSDITFANNILLGGHSIVGDRVTFGGGAAVRQFVRIGEGAMIVGLSGIRADVIPFAIAHGPLADLVGLNVIGLRRRGVTKEGLHRIRDAYQAIFFGAGTFKERLANLPAHFAEEPMVAKILDFIKSAKRPLTMATHRNDFGDAA
jgi:UDP-N-acetylglucosamine acyltransferase